MSVFSGVLGHEPVLQILERGLANPAPAYLFHGPNGVGKRLVAEQFAAALLNPDTRYTIRDTVSPPPSLHAHPDFILLEREEDARDISVEQVRKLLARLHLTSARGGRIVALIDHAERLSDEAANALLKDVEEPPHAVHLVLCSSSFDALPATLRSRMAPLRFDPIRKETLMSWLMGKGVAKEQAERVAHLSRGAPGTAVRLLEQPEALEQEMEDMQLFSEAVTAGSLAQALTAIERVTKSIEAADDPSGAWESFLGRQASLMERVFERDPYAAARVGLGICFATRLVGTGSSPRLALEWSAVSPYCMGETRLPSMLIPFTLFSNP